MIRPATSKDAEDCIPLLFLAMEEIALKLTGLSDAAAAQAIFRELFVQPGNQYSYEHCLVYEGESGIGGMILAYDGGKLHVLRQLVLDHIAAACGHQYMPEDETGPGEYYLDSIAVAAHSQGKGIGGELIFAAIQRARAEGHKKAGLLVSKENPGARRLYERLGFEVRETVQFSGGEYYHLQIDLAVD